MMNISDDELFKIIMERWQRYYLANEIHDEIARRGESVFGKIFDFHGDLPASGNKPETVSARADRQRAHVITHEQRQAAEILNKIPARLVVFIKVDALYSKTYSQKVIAAALGLSADQFKRRKTNAKKLVILFAKLAGVKLKKHYILSHG